MLAQWGQYLLSMALAMACWQVLVSWLALMRGRQEAYSNALSAASLQCVLVLAAFVALVALMLAGDYSVAYVAAHTNDDLAAMFRIAATWSAHEGSMLLWMLMLSGSAVLSARGARSMSLRFRSVNLLVLGLVSLGVIAFVLFSSNPLTQVLPPLEQGADLNPLLQDPGLIFHPPLLYVGYVSTVIVFAATIAALWCGELNRQWAVWLRPYALFSWIFLSCGIALGSYWAYYELGWGGWWFWDPVENASFMPWLAMTALIHSLAVASRRGAFLSWCALLAILAFALSMLGTFLVRSGILVSVHSFASDPQRGIIILALLLSFVVPALALFVARAPIGAVQSRFSWLSAESAVLANNLLLSVACATVFLGTMYPLALEVISAERISVGPPYFNLVFVPLMLPLLALVALAGFIRWRSDSPGALARRLAIPALVWLLLALALVAWSLLSSQLSAAAAGALALGLWAILATLYSYGRSLFEARQSARGWWQAFGGIRLGRHGMHLAHLGLGAFALAAALVSSLGQSHETALRIGDNYRLAGYEFTLAAIDERSGSNYDATYARVEISAGGELISTLEPERRRYHSQPGNPMTEAAIDSRWFGDLFVALSAEASEGNWGLRLQVKPGIYWIWLATLMMAMGGAMAMLGQLRARRF